MLPLATRVLCPYLLAVDTLDRQTFVILFCAKLDECCMYIIEWWCWQG